MDDSGMISQELHEKIASFFEDYKEELNRNEHTNVSHVLYNVNMASDILRYKIEYEIDEYHGNMSEVDTNKVALPDKKSECLIKLQTLTSMLTCHIVDDYQKQMQEKTRPQN